MAHDQKGKQALKRNGRNQAKFDRSDCVGMVAQECPPRLRWRSSVFDHVFGDGVDSATSKPSLSSSPWMRGAPHNGLSLLICWIRSRTSRSIFGRPARCRDFQRQKFLKPARCQRRIVSRLHHLEKVKQIWQNPRDPYKNRPVPPVQPQTKGRPPQGDVELM